MAQLGRKDNLFTASSFSIFHLLLLNTFLTSLRKDNLFTVISVFISTLFSFSKLSNLYFFLEIMVTGKMVSEHPFHKNCLGVGFSNITKWPLYCPQGSGTLRQQLLMMHGIAMYCIVLHSIAWYCMVLHGIAWYCMVLHCIAWYCMIFHDIPCIEVHCIAWYCMVLHGIAWYCMV